MTVNEGGTAAGHEAEWWLTEPVAVRHVAAAENQARADGLWWTPQASLMDVLGLARDEVTNCKVLAWALDPAGSHRVGAGLIQRLFSHLGHPVRSVDSRRATVITELSRLESRADIVITVPGRQPVVIEAKVSAVEGVDQCARIERDWPDSTYVFLSPSGRPPSTTAVPWSWTPFTWS